MRYVSVFLADEKHPRIRGESRMNEPKDVLFTETSPHTRGKLVRELRLKSPPRNIPAYAGKAPEIDGRLIGAQKHPRIRGESLQHSYCLSVDKETSPHTRGKPSPGLILSMVARNIPAYAGKAEDLARRLAADGKHPRIRGESSVESVGFFCSPETSPHTRGKLFV